MTFVHTSLLVSAVAAMLMLGACAGKGQPPVPAAAATPAAPAPAAARPAAPLPPAVVPAAPVPVAPITKSPELPRQLLKASSFSALPGWSQDNLREAWPAFLASCRVLVRQADWKEPCDVAPTVEATSEKAVRRFFESFFVPHQLTPANGAEGLITGYYEPLLRGARKRGGAFQTPLHRAPEDLLTVDLASVYPELKGMRLKGRLSGNKILPYPPRAQLVASGLLQGKELVWVDDPIEAFFLQVQGSGRVYLTDTKEIIRVAYADQNGHPYKSIGRYLVDRGEMTLEQASAQRIKAWYAANPARRQELLDANPSYVFFREEPIGDPNKGPKGSLGVPLTTERSLAIDPQFVPLGIPVFLATTRPGSNVALQRLMLAQDTGGAIKGAGRGDFFWGFGPEAGEKAGKMKQRGTMWLLLPKLPGQRVQ